MAGTALVPGAAGTPVDGQWVHYPPNNNPSIVRWDDSGAIVSSDWCDVWAGPSPSAIGAEFSSLISSYSIAELKSSYGDLYVVAVQSGAAWTLTVRTGAETGPVAASTPWADGQRIAIGYASGVAHVQSGSMDYSAPRTTMGDVYFCFPSGPRMRDVVVGTWPLVSPPAAPAVEPVSQLAFVGDQAYVSWTPDPDQAQTAYEIETSTDDGTTWATGGKIDGDASTAPVGPFTTPGDVLVRVRTWGAAEDPSQWSTTVVVRYIQRYPEGEMVLAITDGLPRVQAPFGLLSVATDRSSTVDRWSDGITWPTLGLDGAAGAPGDWCEDLDPITTDDGWSEATAFLVRSRYDCGLGQDGKEESAALRLAALARAVVEDQVWNGTQAATPYLAADTATTLTTSAEPAAYAVGLVDAFIARTYGSLGVVHMTRETADVAFAAGVLEVRSGRLVTGTGTPVALYAVEPVGPGGDEPATGTAWIYGTPSVAYWVEDLPSQNRVDISTNTFSSELTQRWAVGWDDTGVGAALVDLEPHGGGQ